MDLFVYVGHHEIRHTCRQSLSWALNIPIWNQDEAFMHQSAVAILVKPRNELFMLLVRAIMAQSPSLDVFAISRPPRVPRLSCLSCLATCVVASWTQRRTFPWIHQQCTSRIRVADLCRMGQKIRRRYLLQNVWATHGRSELGKDRD